MPRRLADPGDAEIWGEFYQLYRKLVYGFAAHSGLDHADAEEVTQDVFNEVATNIHDYLAQPQRGSLRGWLLNLTRWRVIDKARRRQRHQKHQQPRSRDSHDRRDDTIEALPDLSPPALDELWEREWEQQILIQALENLRSHVDTRHYQAFELHAAHGLSVRTIAQQLELNPASVYVIHYRLRRLLKAEVDRLKAKVR